jgi:hypothetical protein
MSRVYQKGSKSLGQVMSTVLEDAFAVAMVGLTLLGVSGLVYKSLKPEGWLSMGLDNLWQKSPGLVWFAGFGLAAVTLIIKHYYDLAPSRNRSGNLIAYGFANALRTDRGNPRPQQATFHVAFSPAAASCRWSASWFPWPRCGPRCGSRTRCAPGRI